VLLRLQTMGSAQPWWRAQTNRMTDPSFQYPGDRAR
jgi:hypothetical protein